MIVKPVSVGTVGMVKRAFCYLAIILSCLLVAGCGGKSADPPKTQVDVPVKKQVVVTNSVLSNFVSVISDGQVDIQVITPPNADIRKYVLTSADVTSIANADLVIQSGLGLEPWFDTFIKTADHKGPVVVASTGVSTRVDETGFVDPYVWVSPSNARVMVANVRSALAQILPDSLSVFQSNERGYDSQVDTEISYARRVTAPVSNRRLVYIGEPLGYYCDEFGLTCSAVSPSAVTGNVPPTSAQITEFVKAIQTAKPIAIIFSDNIPKAIVDEVHESATAKITSGSDSLTVESIGDGSTRHPDYLALQRDIAEVVSGDLR